MEKILGTIAFLFLALLRMTYRFTYVDAEGNKVKKGCLAPPYIFGAWHQNIVASILSHPGIKHILMISQSKDGEIISQAIKFLGYVSVRGSSTRGGASARDNMVSLINEKKWSGAITMDGPLGPPHKVKAGIIDVSQKTGAPIILLTPIARRYWSFKSWDRFRLPKPFTKVVIKYSSPIAIPQNLSKEEYPKYIQEIEQIMEKEEIAVTELLG